MSALFGALGAFGEGFANSVVAKREKQEREARDNAFDTSLNRMEGLTNASAPMAMGVQGMGGGGADSGRTASSSAGAGRFDRNFIRDELVKRGLPLHVAEASVVNFIDESGLDPTINEKAPLVPGSRGGKGLYQATGPRRRSMEAMAAQRGVSPDDFALQLDHYVYEMNGPEAAAGKKILATTNTADAAVAILNYFLRPAPEHRATRAARYRTLADPQPAPTVQAVMNRYPRPMGVQ